MLPEDALAYRSLGIYQPGAKANTFDAQRRLTRLAATCLLCVASYVACKIKWEWVMIDWEITKQDEKSSPEEQVCKKRRARIGQDALVTCTWTLSL